MPAHLDRKLYRDLLRMKGQVITVALVMGCGLAIMTMARSLVYSLNSARQEYYEANRFGEIFAVLKRAPNSVAERIAAIPGVAAVEADISMQVTLDLPTLDEPASGLVRSVPESGQAKLNKLFLRSGRWLSPGGRGEVLVGEAFAEANELQPGDRISMLLNGKRQELRVAGIVLSPEFIFESRPGAALPDNRTYGIFWMPYKEVGRAFDLDGAFNSVSVTLEPGASEHPVMDALDQLLAPYGGRGTYGRADHPSDVRVSGEIGVLRTLSIGFPVAFLSVAAFMINAVLSRLLNLQREQIALLKAFGFTNRQIVIHYLKFALVMVALGTFLGASGGLIIGKSMVHLYHRFFHFPDLLFRPDRLAFPLALLACCFAATLGVFGAVRRAARLPPAEAMRPEPPANYRPALVERTGIPHFLSHTFRIAVRNLERKPAQAILTVVGLALATGILVIPNCFRDGVNMVMDYQWDLVQRSDLSLGLIEPGSDQIENLFEKLPGAVRVEPVRTAFVRISNGQHRRQLGIVGLPADGLHNRVIDASVHRFVLPSEGVVLSAKLAEGLHAKVGDLLLIEALEGRRKIRFVPLIGLAEDFAGVTAFMEIHAVNRLLEEGDVITGASFAIDSARRGEFLHALKEIPRVSWVAIKESLRENFRQTTAASIGLVQTLYLFFAMIVAFGVVYNNARISLAERARELATLRVIGFSQREVGAVLVTELVLLAMVAVPLGLLLGSGFAAGIVRQVNTETVRLPLVLTLHNYTFAVLVVTIGSILSAFVVLRKLSQLDLVGALKAPE
jgi:putative ABC transport system permease protein